MIRYVILAPLVLAACNSQPVVIAENASIAEVAAKTQNAVKITPGEWSHKAEVIKFDIPGIKDARMKKTMGEAMTSAQSKLTRYCITPEEANQPRFGGDPGKDCRYERFAMAAGRFDAVMTCAPREGGTMRMVMKGKYSPTTYDVTVDMNMKGAAGPAGGAMAMTVRAAGKRVGECKA